MSEQIKFVYNVQVVGAVTQSQGTEVLWFFELDYKKKIVTVYQDDVQLGTFENLDFPPSLKTLTGMVDSFSNVRKLQ